MDKKKNWAVYLVAADDMHDFKIGSHDTMTYLKPKKWWLYPFRFMARCQSKPIEEQYEKYGIRYFDLRISYDKKTNEREFRHGVIAYKADVWKVLEYLNSHNEEVWVRLLLEEYRDDKDNRQEELFKKDCALFEKTFTNLKFHCGRMKRTWGVLYEFPTPEPEIDQRISSMTWKIWDDWCPWFYARFMNHKNLEKGTDKDWMLLDFLHIR